MLAERAGNSQLFDALEARVFKGAGEYTMYDETVRISFRTRTEGNVTHFDIKPSSDCVTKRIKVVFCNYGDVKFTVPERLSSAGNAVEVPCREMTVVAEEIPVGKEKEE